MADSAADTAPRGAARAAEQAADLRNGVNGLTARLASALRAGIVCVDERGTRFWCTAPAASSPSMQQQETQLPRPSTVRGGVLLNLVGFPLRLYSAVSCVYQALYQSGALGRWGCR